MADRTYVEIPTLPGVKAEYVTTSRLTTRVLFSGAETGIPVLLVHGNVANATHWEEMMVAMPSDYRPIAPDNRGRGRPENNKKVDATRGMGDFADDAFALMDHLGYDKFHVVGHSMGGSIVWRMMMEQPERLLTVTMAAPGSPFGFGGTKGLDGQINHKDGAGSGGGLTSPAFAEAVANGDRSSDNPQTSPRVFLNSFYVKPPFKIKREEEYLSGLLAMHVGEQDWPGDSVPSENWPGRAPGKYGPNNALSPLYRGDVSKLWSINPKPPVLWIHGLDDQIVSDTSLFDLGTLGKMGLIPGWPGEDVFPSQPMVGQTRYALDKYAENGGAYKEVALEDCGHYPYVEKPEQFNTLLHEHLKSV